MAELAKAKRTAINLKRTRPQDAVVMSGKLKSRVLAILTGNQHIANPIAMAIFITLRSL